MCVGEPEEGGPGGAVHEDEGGGVGGAEVEVFY